MIQNKNQIAQRTTGKIGRGVAVADALRRAADAVGRLRPRPTSGAARRLALVVGRLRNVADAVESTQLARSMTMRSTNGGTRALDQTATQDALLQMDQSFDALDAILAAIGPVRQQLDEARAVVRNLIAGSLETAPAVKIVVKGDATAHTMNAKTGRSTRVIIHKSALRRRCPR
jgi:hypothetical protein